MDNIQILRLDPKNWQELKEIRLESLKSDPAAFGGSYDAESNYADEKWIERTSDRNRFYLLAKDNGKTIGMIGIAKSRDKSEQDSLILIGMYVNKAYRGNGIGKALVKQALLESKSIPNMKNVKLWVHEDQVAAVNLYKSCGFRVTGEIGENPSVDPMYHNTTVMVLELST